MALFAVFAEMAGGDTPQAQKREKKKADALQMVPSKLDSQQAEKQEEARQIGAAYQLMSDYRIYFPLGSKLLGQIYKEIVFDPQTDSIIYREANKWRIGNEVKPDELPSDISSCAATYFKSVEKACADVARIEKDGTIRSLAENLAKVAEGYGNAAKLFGNDRMKVLGCLLEFRDAYEEHIGRIATEDYWNKLHEEAGSSTLRQGQLYAKRYGETALFFLAMGVTAATDGLAAPWAFGMMGSKTIAQSITNQNPEQFASGLGMLIPFAPNRYLQQFGSLYIGGTVAGSAIKTTGMSIRTGTITTDDKASLIGDMAIGAGYWKGINAAIRDAKKMGITPLMHQEALPKSKRKHNTFGSRRGLALPESKGKERENLVKLASVPEEDPKPGNVPNLAGKGVVTVFSPIEVRTTSRTQSLPIQDMQDFTYLFKEEGKDLDSWRRSNTRKIFSLMQMHKEFAGLLFAINGYVNETLMNEAKPGFLNNEKIRADLYVPTGGSLTYLSIDSKEGTVTIRLKGSEEKPFNPSAGQEREIKVPVSELVPLSLAKNGVTKLDFDSVPKEILQYPLYAMFYCAAKEKPEQVGISKHFIEEHPELVFLDATKNTPLIRVPPEEIYFTEKEQQLMQRVAPVFDNFLHSSSYLLSAYSTTPEFETASKKCFGITRNSESGHSRPVFLRYSANKADRLRHKYSDARRAAMEADQNIRNDIFRTKAKLRNMSDAEVEQKMSTLDNALANVEKAKRDIIDFSKKLKD